MTENDNILNFDFSSHRKLKNFFLSLGICVLSLTSFFIFSSYHYPSKLNVNTVQFNNLIKLQTSSLLKLTIEDTTENINDQVNDLLVKFYTNRNYKLAWIENYKTNNQFDAYINLLDSAKYFGFPFDYFSYDKIRSLRSELNKIDTKNHLNTLIELELTTTYSSLKFLIYLNQGIIEKDTSKLYTTYISSLPAYLSESINSGNLRNRIAAVQPNVVEHEKLLKSLPYFIDLILSIKFTTPAFIDDQLLAKSLYYSGISKHTSFDSTNTKRSALFALQDQYKLTNDPQLNDSFRVCRVETSVF